MLARAAKPSRQRLDLAQGLVNVRRKGILERGVVLGMPDNYLWQMGPSTLWVMAGAEATPGDPHPRVGQFATPLPVAVTAAGLVSAVRLGSDAVRRSEPRVAQWDAIRSHYREVADWIDRDAAGGQPAAPATEFNPAGRMSHAGVLDYLGLLDSDDDVDGWLSHKPQYWVTTGESVEAATTAVAAFRRDYRHAAVIGPLNIYRRCAPADTPA